MKTLRKLFIFLVFSLIFHTSAAPAFAQGFKWWQTERFKKELLFSASLKKELFEEYVQFIHEDRHLEKELVQQEIEQLESRASAFLGDLDLAEIKERLALAG